MGLSGRNSGADLLQSAKFESRTGPILAEGTLKPKTSPKTRQIGQNVPLFPMTSDFVKNFTKSLRGGLSCGLISPANQA